jgi:glycosyltransferase involved in cell wall biosynthesis
MPAVPGRLVSGVMFFPRGGSAHVARALSLELERAGWSVILVSGSRSDSEESDARRFYRGVDVRPVDFTAALREPDPVRPRSDVPPMHPSFEERQGAPDPVFAALDEVAYRRQVSAWEAALSEAGAAGADALYLHHLTPLNEAAALAAPGVPVLGHVHGTELLMLEAIERGPPKGWPFARPWADRMREWAARCERISVSPAGAKRARRLLGVPGERLLEMPNGFDPQLFRPAELDRVAHWRRHLVAGPRGWRPGGGPGSVAYTEGQLANMEDGVVVLYVGRFTEVKRLPLLFSAWAEARGRFRRPAALVLVGGHPGEWEGEHPVETVDRLGLDDVFLAGWHGHEELPAFLNCSDVVVLPSVREQFGLVLVEGMACGRPGIGADTLGPATIIDDGETGWLFPPDDEAALSAALEEAVNDDAERRRRGELGRRSALERYSWPRLAERLDEALRDAAGLRPRAAGAETV